MVRRSLVLGVPKGTCPWSELVKQTEREQKRGYLL